jgi:hypothetical protein
MFAAATGGVDWYFNGLLGIAGGYRLHLRIYTDVGTTSDVLGTV